MKSVFNPADIKELTSRINKLSSESTPHWGKMSVSKMLAHCNVSYEMVYEAGKHPRPKGFMKFILKVLVKNKVVGTKPYQKNGPTAPAFIIKKKRILKPKRHVC